MRLSNNYRQNVNFERKCTGKRQRIFQCSRTSRVLFGSGRAVRPLCHRQLENGFRRTDGARLGAQRAAHCHSPIAFRLEPFPTYYIDEMLCTVVNKNYYFDSLLIIFGIIISYKLKV